MTVLDLDQGGTRHLPFEFDRMVAVLNGYFAFSLPRSKTWTFLLLQYSSPPFPAPLESVEWLLCLVAIPLDHFPLAHAQARTFLLPRYSSWVDMCNVHAHHFRFCPSNPSKRQKA